MSDMIGDDNPKKDLVSAFEDSRYFNDLIIDAANQGQSDVIIEILGRDHFLLDPTRRIGKDNILMYAIKNDWDDLIDALLECPDNTVKKLVEFHYQHNYQTHSPITVAIDKDKASAVKKIVKTGLSTFADSATIARIGNKSLETVKAFSWNEERINDCYLSRNVGWDTVVIENTVTHALENKKWDNAKFLVQHPAFNPFYNRSSRSYEPYKKARWLARNNPEAKEIADLILKRIEELRPEKARKLKRGWLGTGLGAHKLG